MTAPTLATHWMIVANSTLNEAVSHDSYHPIWKKFVANLLSFRQALSCTVCKGILEEAFSPIPTSFDEDCQHHTCKGCLGKKKWLKPFCTWCKNYDNYVRCTLIDNHIRSYANLCEYLRQSRQYPVVKNEEIIDVTSSIDVPEALRDSRGLCVEKLVNEIMVLSGSSGIVIRDRPLLQMDELSDSDVTENSDSRSEDEFKFGDFGSPSVGSSDDADFCSYSSSLRDEDDGFLGDNAESLFSDCLGLEDGSGQEVGIVSPLDDDPSFMALDEFVSAPTSPAVEKPEPTKEAEPEPDVKPDAMTTTTPVASSSLPLNGASDETVADQQTKGMILRIRTPAAINAQVPVSSNSSGREAATSGAAAGSWRLRYERKPNSSGRATKSKKGCRCGTATNNPGTLTCCGQRCPCYVDGKECVDCKCRGCRNPYRSGGRKVRPHIVPTESIQVHFPPSPRQYLRSHDPSLSSPSSSSSVVQYLTKLDASASKVSGKPESPGASVVTGKLVACPGGPDGVLKLSLA